MTIENKDEIKNNDQQEEQQQDQQEQESNTKEKPSLFDGVDAVDNSDDNNNDDQESQEDEFDYSKILGEEYEDSEKEKIDNLREKYKDESDLLKALYNANKVIGKKTDTAPESYKFEKSEDLDIEINEDIMESFSELAKENGLTNDQYNNLVNNFAKQTNEIMNKAIEAEKENIQNEIKEIENFNTRASNLLGKAKGILSESEFKTLQNSVHSKEHFEVLEKLINSTKNTTIKTNTLTEQGVKTIQNQIEGLTSKIMGETNNNTRTQLINERRELISKLESSKE